MNNSYKVNRENQQIAEAIFFGAYLSFTSTALNNGLLLLIIKSVIKHCVVFMCVMPLQAYTAR